MSKVKPGVLDVAEPVDSARAEVVMAVGPMVTVKGKGVTLNSIVPYSVALKSVAPNSVAWNFVTSSSRELDSVAKSGCSVSAGPGLDVPSEVTSFSNVSVAGPTDCPVGMAMMLELVLDSCHELVWSELLREAAVSTSVFVVLERLGMDMEREGEEVTPLEVVLEDSTPAGNEEGT